MLNNIKRIAIMGGTFNPIHYGHLILAEEARYEFDIQKVIFIPTGDPPHKAGVPIIDKGHRYNMAKLAIENNSFFELSRMEIDRVGKSYSVDTIRSLTKIYGQGTEIFFITGSDAIAKIEEWHDADEVLRLCSFITAMRPGGDSVLNREAIEKVKNKYKAKIFFIDLPKIDISSTDIRKRLEEERPIKYMLPESVEKYIEENKLYLMEC